MSGRKINRAVSIIAVWISFGVGASSFADAPPRKPLPPPPTTYIYDEPSLLSAQAHEEIFHALSSEDRQTGNQVLVAIFTSLENEDLVDYTNRLYQSWKIGAKQKSNGVLMSIFVKEHKVRIEVGYGLEGDLTDAKSSRIITTILAPAFKQNAYDDGVKSATQAILSTIDPAAHTDQPAPVQNEPVQQRLPLPMIVLLLFFFISFLSRFFRRGTTIRRGGFGGGFWGGGFGGGGSGGFGGGGGGGFGGFGGGGGSSGGGGASGGW